MCVRVRALRFSVIYADRCHVMCEWCSDEMYRAILVAFFLLQTVLSYLIPVIGPATSFIHLSWLYSLYCFEYKWSLAGWSLERRLAHLEQNWAYFAGFGSPFTLATFFVPNFVSKGIFALLFPVVRASLFLVNVGDRQLTGFVPCVLAVVEFLQFLLLAIACDPVSEGDEASKKLPIFRCVLLQCLVRLRFSKEYN